MIAKKERMLLVVWLIVNLAIGLWIVRDYGLSTDEPYYYLYADDSLRAYKTFFGRLSEPAYGVENLRYYGPAFILIVNSIVKILPWLPINISEIGVWHYSYFVTFQLTGLCLYGLTKRWFNVWTAWAVLVLFITQPLLWGHAFINPKDIPFMFFFTFSVWAGYLLVDSLALETTTMFVKRTLSDFRSRFASIAPHKKQIFWSGLLLVGAGLTLSRGLFYFAIDRVVKIFYFAAPGSWAANLMRNFADDSSRIPVEDYVAKAQTLYARFDFVLYLFGFLIMSIYLISLLTNTSVDTQMKRLWQRFPLKDSQSIRQFIKQIYSRMRLQKTFEFIRQTAQALVAPKVVLAGVVLGLATSVRVLGPLAGVIVILSLFIQMRKRSFPIILAYLLWAGLITYLTWPFLWPAPVANIYETLSVMSNFPWSGTVLFDGKLYFADNLPVTFLPVLMNLQFTETHIILSYLGFGFFIWQLFCKEIRLDLLLYIGLGFLFPMIGFIVFRPPLYENFRQLLFLLPAMFLFGAFTLEFLFTKMQRHWQRFAVILLIVIPGLISLVKLHPYQYIYYNSLIGGAAGAFRRFELDYWYTSYSELTSWVNENAEEGATVVARVAHILINQQIRPDLAVIKIGSSSFDLNQNYDYAILTTRWNTDENYPDAEIISVVEREGAILGVLKDIKGQKFK